MRFITVWAFIVLSVSGNNERLHKIGHRPFRTSLSKHLLLPRIDDDILSIPPQNINTERGGIFSGSMRFAPYPPASQSQQYARVPEKNPVSLELLNSVNRLFGPPPAAPISSFSEPAEPNPEKGLPAPTPESSENEYIPTVPYSPLIPSFPSSLIPVLPSEFSSPPIPPELAKKSIKSTAPPSPSSPASSTSATQAEPSESLTESDKLRKEYVAPWPKSPHSPLLSQPVAAVLEYGPPPLPEPPQIEYGPPAQYPVPVPPLSPPASSPAVPVLSISELAEPNSEYVLPAPASKSSEEEYIPSGPYFPLLPPFPSLIPVPAPEYSPPAISPELSGFEKKKTLNQPVKILHQQHHYHLN